MPLHTGNTYVIPKRGVVNTKRKTFSGKGPAPSGSRKVKAPTIATVPVVTTSSTGHVSAQNFSSPRAASQAKRQARSSQRRVRRIEAQQASALAFHRRAQQRASEATPHVPESHAKLTSLGGSAGNKARVAVQPPPPSYKPPKFQGAKTVGTPTLGSLRQAANAGTLKFNRKGYATTPAVRRVSKEVKKAQRAVRRSQPSVKGLSPAERAVVPLVRKAHRKQPDIPASLLMSLTRQESTFDPAAKSPADAQGLTQFIPSTATSYGVRYGTGRKEQQSQETGAAKLLHNSGFASDPKGALTAYTGGYSDAEYNNPVLEGAADYKALDKPGNPKALKQLAVTKRKALNLGLAVGKQANVGQAPPRVVKKFKAAVSAMKQIDAKHFEYQWGGGHAGTAGEPVGGPGPGFDCSGAVSAMLHSVGALDTPLTSGNMGQALKPGPGAITVFYNSVHTFAYIPALKKYWGTSTSNAGGGAGFFPKSVGDAEVASGNSAGSYAVGHVPGLGKKQAAQMGVNNLGPGAQPFPGMTISPSGTTATINPSSGTTQEKAGFSASPIKLTRAQKAHRTLKKLAQLGAGVSQSSSGSAEDKGAILKQLEATYGKKAA